VIICPVCSAELFKKEKAFVCEKGHSFDMAKEGYVNLLRSSKSGDFIGDNKEMARSRRDFLNKGYYNVLKDKLCELLNDKSGNLLDICCGEGYYTSALAENSNLNVWGFDISKEMVRLAAKRKKGNFFVANMASIPVKSESVDIATHLFAPINEKEFYRILKKGGMLISVTPSKNHLIGLKRAVYEEAYLNDEEIPLIEGFEYVETVRVESVVTFNSNEDIEAVFKMTPYYYRTGKKDQEKLKNYQSLTTEIGFLINIYRKL